MLFGVPDRSRLEEAYGENNPVWKAVGPLLGWVSRGVVLFWCQCMLAVASIYNAAPPATMAHM